jgi:hypothetical protein
LGDFTFLYTDWFYCVHLLMMIIFMQGIKKSVTFENWKL